MLLHLSHQQTLTYLHDSLQTKKESIIFMYHPYNKSSIDTKKTMERQTFPGKVKAGYVVALYAKGLCSTDVPNIKNINTVFTLTIITVTIDRKDTQK